MDFDTLAQDFPRLLDSGLSLELKSSPGAGKSEFVKEQVAALSKRDGEPWGLSTLFMATQTPSDLMGFGVPMRQDDGTYAMCWSKPAWMTCDDGTPMHAYKRGILFFDEWGQGESDVKRVSAELFLNKRCGPHFVPEGWSVVSASNRAGDRSGVTKNFDFIINRRMELEVDTTFPAWNNWAARKNIHPVIRAFAEQCAGEVFTGKVPDKQGPWLTPRSLVMAGKLLESISDDSERLRDDTQAMSYVSGMIGEGNAAQFFAMVRLGNEMPKYEEIVADPKGTKLSKKPDALLLVCHNLAARCREEDLEPVVDYVQRMPAEFTITFCRTAVHRMPGFVNTPSFHKWARANSSLMSAILMK